MKHILRVTLGLFLLPGLVFDVCMLLGLGEGVFGLMPKAPEWLLVVGFIGAILMALPVGFVAFVVICLAGHVVISGVMGLLAYVFTGEWNSNRT